MLGSFGSIVLGAALSVALILASPVAAQDLSTALSSAEESAASAEVAIAEAREQVGAVQRRYEAASAAAEPARQAARAARGEAHAQKATIAARRAAAAERIAQLEADHRSEVDEHDERVRNGIGAALATLAAGAIALSWGWFRTSAAVSWLVGLQLAQAIGICVGGGLLALIVGSALASADGFLGSLGVFVALLGPLLAVSLLLARHSAQVQAGRERALLGRERLPDWIATGLAGLMAILCLASLGSAFLSTSPEAASASPQVRATAAGRMSRETKRGLAAAEGRAAVLGRRATRLTARQDAARATLRKVRGELASAQSELTAAEGEIRRYTHRIEVVEAREARQREREEEQALIAAEEEAETEEEASSGCDTNYTGCVPETGYDVDCSEVSGPVEVIGTDVDGLDADGDGIGCES